MNADAQNPTNPAAKRRYAGRTPAERSVASWCERLESEKNDVTIAMKNHGKPVAHPAKLSQDYVLRKSGLIAFAGLIALIGEGVSIDELTKRLTSTKGTKQLEQFLDWPTRADDADGAA
jgi:hypothetical protein